MQVGFYFIGGAFAVTCYTCTETQKDGLTLTGDVGCVDGIYSGELDVNMTAEGDWCTTQLTIDYQAGTTIALRDAGSGTQPDYASWVTEIRE